MREQNNDHIAEIDFESSMYPNLVCNAPEQSFCHAVWTCDCEQWDSQGIKDGKPWHESNHGDFEEDYIYHEGTFNSNECNYTDWFDCGEMLTGSIKFPVETYWTGDCLAFRISVEEGTV